MDIKNTYGFIKERVLKNKPTPEDNEKYKDISFSGEVYSANKLGSQMGFPTANFKIKEEDYSVLDSHYQDNWGNHLDFILSSEVEIDGDENKYNGILIIEYDYNWTKLKESLSNGYNPEENSYIVVRKEFGNFYVSDGSHRHELLMHSVPNENIDVKTEDGEIISLKVKDIVHNHIHAHENQISIHIFDFSGDIYGKNITVYPKNKITHEVFEKMNELRKVLK